MSKDAIAWTIAILGVSLEIFIATLDAWFDMPHLVFHIGDGVGFKVIK